MQHVQELVYLARISNIVDLPNKCMATMTLLRFIGLFAPCSNYNQQVCSCWCGMHAAPCSGLVTHSCGQVEFWGIFQRKITMQVIAQHFSFYQPERTYSSLMLLLDAVVIQVTMVEGLRLRSNAQRPHGAKHLPQTNRNYGDKGFCSTKLVVFTWRYI